ncbi:MAG: hypothetical protein CL693_08765 [Cellvibrionaceae bacterium]|nr:hypothetical protein [Cellvibrionaceae bacterium]|tara:strand:+ start:11846 stop:12103 length:258 start_codon:yes stop_codon:yes gene_type:complete
MQREYWQSLNDIIALFTARPIALPLLALLLIKIYLISPETLVYVGALLLLSTLSALRWGIHYLAMRKLEFVEEYRKQRRGADHND